MSLESQSDSANNEYYYQSYQSCPDCFSQFHYLKKTNTDSSKLPLILNCKHTVCEQCIYEKSKFSQCYICPVCRKPNTVPSNKIQKLWKLFTPHYTLIGVLLLEKNLPNKTSFNLEPTGISLKDKKLLDIDSSRSSSSCDNEFDIKCTVDETFHDLEFSDCLIHEGQFSNLFCEPCNDLICCYCFVENHNNHKIKHLYKMKEDEIEDFQKKKAYAVKVLKQLHHTQCKIDDIKNFDRKKVQVNIATCFSNLHAKLHVTEKNLYNKLENLKFNSNNFNNIEKDVKKNLCEVNELLRVCDLIDKKCINIPMVLNKLKNIENIPCKLVSEEGKINPISFSVSNHLKNLEEQFSLEVTEGNYSLTASIDEDFDFIDDKKSSISSLIDSASQCSKYSDSMASFAYPMKTPQIVENKEKPSSTGDNKVDGNNSKEMIKVILTHVNSMDSFYILPSNKRNELQKLEKALSRDFARSIAVDHAAAGMIFSVIYEENNQRPKLRRGKVLKIDKKKGFYYVFFIDYGNSMYVKREKLRTIKANLFTKPPMVIECKLYNPYNIQWEPNTHLELVQLIYNQQLFMKIINVINHLHVVDLIVLNSKQNYQSVSELLVSSCQKNIPPLMNQPEIEQQQQSVNEIKLYKNSNVFKRNDTEQVVITHIVDPFTIYVQMASTVEIFLNLQSLLNKFYEKNNNLHCIPIVGSDIVVKYKLDEEFAQWYRATVKTINNDKTADVFLVDIGQIITVNWHQCCMLNYRFIKTECLAIPIKLAHIKPIDKENHWSNKSIEYLRELHSHSGYNKKYKILVNESNPLEVALFEEFPTVDICINALLVENDMAESTGILSKTVSWYCNNEEEESDVMKNYTLCSQLIKDTENLQEVQEDNIKKGLLKEIKIVHCVSPSLIYFKFNEFNEKETIFNQELQVFYASNEKENIKNNIKFNEIIVIFDVKANFFKRGIIKKQIDNEKFLIHLIDEVNDLTVLKNDIYKYDEYFQSLQVQFVYKCSLSKIKPAGDSGKWSKTAIEMLKELFKCYKNIFIRKTSIKDKLLNVEMWYSLKSGGDALNIARTKYVSINKSLLQAGLAFCIGQLDEEPLILNEPISTSLTLPSFDNISDNSSIKEENHLNENNEKVDWNTLMEIDEIEASTEDVNWLKPLKLTKMEFDGFVICVESDGTILMRDNSMQELYEDLEDKMKVHFSKNPPINKDIDWKQNQKCTIKENRKYYRGTVLNVINNKELSVYMIDWGSVHEIEKKFIYDEHMFPDVEQLVTRVKLFNIKPKDDKWSHKDITCLLEGIPAKVKVKVKSDLNDDIPEVELYTEDHENVNDYLVDNNSNLIRIKKIVSETPPSSPIEEDYKSALLLQSDEEEEEIENILSFIFEPLPLDQNNLIPVYITEVSNFDEIVFDVLNGKNSSNFFNSTLHKDIQKCAKKQEFLDNFELNQPCICHFNERGWSRALIYNTDTVKYGYCTVFVVDYGIFHITSIEDVRKIQPDWLEWPVRHYISKLNFVLNNENLKDIIRTQMNTLVGKSCSIKIVSSKPLIVNLYNDLGTLCYQNLINAGLIINP